MKLPIKNEMPPIDYKNHRILPAPYVTWFHIIRLSDNFCIGAAVSIEIAKQFIDGLKP